MMNNHFKITIFIIFTAIVGASLSTLSSWSIYNTEYEAIKIEFRKDINARAISIYRGLGINFETLISLSLLFRDNRLPSEQDFNFQTRKIIARHTDIEALKWLSVDELSQSIENTSCFSNYIIKDKSKFLQLLKKTKEIPFSQVGNSIILQEKNSLKQVIFAFLPIYKGNPQTQLQCKNNFRGYLLGIFSFKGLFLESTLSKIPLGIDMKFLNKLDLQNPQILHIHKSKTASKPFNNISYTKDLPIIWGNKFSLQANPTISYVNSRKTKNAQTIFIFGILFTILIVLYISSTTKRARIIEKIVVEKTKKLQIANHSLKQLSRLDALTNIANRRAMDEFLAHEYSRSIRHNKSISFIIIDIDFFKQYNDNYGHLQGDDCLKKVAHALSGVIYRSTDLLARYGGEEFAIILSQTQNALHVAYKCQNAIEKLKIKHQFSSVSEFLTISAGVCSYTPKSGDNPQCIIEAADKALYIAKANGRNRVESTIF